MTIDQTIRSNLLAIARAYARRQKLSLSTVGRQFYGNQSFFVTLRKRDGISITPPKLDGLLQAFSDRWPEGLPWPETAPVTMERRPRKNGGKESTRSLDASAPAERIA